MKHTCSQAGCESEAWNTVEQFPTTYRSAPGGLAKHNRERGWKRPARQRSGS